MTKEELNIAKRQFILECAKIGERPTNKAFNKMINEIAGMNEQNPYQKLLYQMINEINSALDMGYKGSEWKQFLIILVDDIETAAKELN